MPVVQPSRADGGSGLGAFDLTIGTSNTAAMAISLSNREPTARIKVTNRGLQGASFSLTKVSHHSLLNGIAVEIATDSAATPPVQALPFLALALDGLPPVAANQVVTRRLGPGESAMFVLSATLTPVPDAWNGVIRVSGEGASQTVSLGYMSKPDGRWAGTITSFANFGTVGLQNLPTPPGASSLDSAVRAGLGNALLQQWAAFRWPVSGGISQDQMEAIFTSVISGSWKSTPCGGGSACALYSSAPGGTVVLSSNQTTAPVPSGALTMPFVVDVSQSQTSTGDTYVGRVVSESALQYPNSPVATMAFAAVSAGTAQVPLTKLSAEVVLGARAPFSVVCPSGLKPRTTPWLLTDFTAGTSTDSSSGLLSRSECADSEAPYASSSPRAAWSLALAGANPMADGYRRVRKLELVDAVLLNGRTILGFVKETFGANFLSGGSQPFENYGIVRLDKTPAEVDPSTMVGLPGPDASAFNTTGATATLSRGLACSTEMVTRVLGRPTYVGTDGNTLALGLIDGSTSSASLTEITKADVHYLCADTKKFDTASACPAGSQVTFFTGTGVSRDLGSLPCIGPVNSSGTCDGTLAQWQASGSNMGISTDIPWKCTNANEAICEANRSDLRADKTFYASTVSASGVRVMVPLRPTIDGAFRYRTRFRNRQGTGIGFTPSVCVPGSSAVPYCYDPAAVEEARARIDCLMRLRLDGDLTGSSLTSVTDFLRESLSVASASPGVVAADGFERLYSELLVMLGDDAFTKSSQSRFDLAGQLNGGFNGSRFEPGGVDLSGASGFELVQLTRAIQYDQIVVDRFFRILPAILGDMVSTGSKMTSSAMVTTYLPRARRASVQKARSWGAIGARYAALGKPELARMVVGRAYSATFVESVVLSDLYRRAMNAFADPDRAQVAREAEQAALVYRAALTEMKIVYDSVRDDPTSFGFAADYVPFPALSPSDANAFVVLNGSAQSALLTARAAEDAAIASTRSFDTDAQAFQGELVRIRNNYENQLAGLCGTFLADDGRVLPAITKYASASARTHSFGQPCGLTRTGQIYDAMVQSEQAALDAQRIRGEFTKVLEVINLERTRQGAQCRLILSLADMRYSVQGRMNSLEHDISNLREALGFVDRIASTAISQAAAFKCGGIAECATGAASIGMIIGVSAGQEAAHLGGEDRIRANEDKVRDLQAGLARDETVSQCEAVTIDSTAVIATQRLNLATIQLDALRAAYEGQRRNGAIASLRDQATRLETEQAESEQLEINLQAAKNDPNVRIYKNDAVLTAERTFASAIAVAYKLTRVFEYYTSQSYARSGQLALVRMVAHGDYSLERYVQELQAAYDLFGETYGRPDVRVARISLRDDILAIPLLDDRGVALTVQARVDEFRRRLAEPQRHDGRGYLVIPFATSYAKLSPLTRSHKILYTEAEIVGASNGDAVGRVYLSQFGTGGVQPITGVTNYYRFPERTAVINPFFNGRREFTAEVYRNDRLRDRPFVNSNWEFVFNQVDEEANRDVVRNALTDIVFYVYYTDFTSY